MNVYTENYFKYKPESAYAFGYQINYRKLLKNISITCTFQHFKISRAEYSDYETIWNGSPQTVIHKFTNLNLTAPVEKNQFRISAQYYLFNKYFFAQCGVGYGQNKLPVYSGSVNEYESFKYTLKAQYPIYSSGGKGYEFSYSFGTGFNLKFSNHLTLVTSFNYQRNQIRGQMTQTIETNQSKEYYSCKKSTDHLSIWGIGLYYTVFKLKNHEN